MSHLPRGHSSQPYVRPRRLMYDWRYYPIISRLPCATAIVLIMPEIYSNSIKTPAAIDAKHSNYCATTGNRLKLAFFFSNTLLLTRKARLTRARKRRHASIISYSTLALTWWPAHERSFGADAREGLLHKKKEELPEKAPP